eukprot:CFRG2171T1
MEERAVKVITGHGIDADIVQKCSFYGKQFFAQPEQEKMKVKAREEPMGNDSPSIDNMESLLFCNGSENGPNPTIPIYEDFNSTVEAYCDSMRSLNHDILQLTARSLGAERTYFDEYFQDKNDYLKLSWYPEQRQSLVPGQLRYGAHTDITAITILKTDEPGLQVSVDGEWIPVPLMQDAFVVNIGDTMERVCR